MSSTVDQGDHMLSLKIFTDVSNDPFAGGNRYGQSKSSRPALIPLALSLSAPLASGPRRRLAAFHIENHVFAVAEALANLPMLLYCTVQSSGRSVGSKRPPGRLNDRPPPPPIYILAWTTA
jgi:hypothetical protein